MSDIAAPTRVLAPRAPGDALVHAELSRMLSEAGVALGEAMVLAEQLGPDWHYYAEALGRQSDDLMQQSIEHIDDTVGVLVRRAAQP